MDIPDVLPRFTAVTLQIARRVFRFYLFYTMQHATAEHEESVSGFHGIRCIRNTHLLINKIFNKIRYLYHLR